MAISPRLSYHISSQNFLQYFLIFFLHFFSLPKTAPYYAIEGVTPYDVIYGLYFCFLGYSLRSTQLKSIRTHNGIFARNCSKIMWPVYLLKQLNLNTLHTVLIKQETQNEHLIIICQNLIGMKL